MTQQSSVRVERVVRVRPETEPSEELIRTRVLKRVLHGIPIIPSATATGPKRTLLESELVRLKDY